MSKVLELNMSRFRYLAKLVVQSDFLTSKLFDFYTQLIVYAPSHHAIKQSKSLANTLGKGRVGTVSTSSESVLQSLALLSCFELPDSEFIRIGPNYDGGYVLYKDIQMINKVVSIGIAEDTSFEEDFNTRKLDVEFFYLIIQLFQNVNFPRILIFFTRSWEIKYTSLCKFRIYYQFIFEIR